MTHSEQSFIDKTKLYELANTPEPTDAETDEILNKALKLKGITSLEAAKLLNIQAPQRIKKLLEAAGSVKELIYGKRLVLFAPLYVGNGCTNNCLYCAFRKDNTSIKRIRLEADQIVAETELLIQSGHKRVLLIGGEDAHTKPDYYREAMRAIYSAKVGRDSIRRVNLEIAPMEVSDFAKFKDEKIGTYICFQETYDEDVYARVHPSGRKRDFLWRLFVMDRAMEGGLGDVGIGALFGLTDYRFETLALLEHSKHLEDKFGVGPHTVSVPRIEPADGAPMSFDVPHAVTDDEFKKLIAVIRLAVPFTGIILSTREKEEIRRELFHYGVSQISAGSRTNPGGYSAEGEDGSQFSLGDHRSLDEVISSLIDDGYVPSFCTGCYRKGRVGKDFMDLAKPGLIAHFCLPNGLFTFKEYLNDYALPATKTKGDILLQQLIAGIADEKVRTRTADNIAKIEAGERDLYL